MPESEETVIGILHVEDNPTDAELVRATLEEAGLACSITVVKTRKDFDKAVRSKKFDVILSDFSLPSFTGREAFDIARTLVPDTPFVFVSGTLGEDAAIQALVDGATDYVLKTKMARLVPAVRRAIHEVDARRRLKLAEKLREMALEDLRVSEARFRGVLESAPDSAIIIDSEGRIAFANPQTEKMFGLNKDELLGKPLDILVPDRHKKLHSKHVEEFSSQPHARGMNSGVELSGKRRDGTEFPADIMLSPLMMGRDMSVLAMIRDTTSTKLAEKALRDSEEQFRTIYESSPVAILNVAFDGSILKCNLAASKLLGYSSEELRSMNVSDITYAEDKEIGPRMMKELEAGRSEVVHFEKRYNRKDDKTIRVHLTVSAVRNDDVKSRYTIGIIEDITEKWQAGEALRRSEEKYRSLVDNARDAIYTLSSNATILSLNPAFETLTGWRRDEWLGKSMTDLIHPDDRRKAVDSFQKTVQGELADIVQYRVLRKSGDYATGEFGTTRLVLEDGSIGLLGIARDVTTQIILEEQLKQSQKMESIGTLAGGIAHDFNNILGIIMGYASLTLRSLKEDDRLTANIRSIESAAQRGVDVVRQLLMFARKQERVVQLLDVNEIVADVFTMTKETFPKMISVKLMAGDGIMVVLGDQTEIHQAVLNLCVNARDAMIAGSHGKLPGGTLTLGTSLVPGAELKLRQPLALAEAYVRIEVSDTGTGMDDQTRARIFEPFFTTKEKGKGTGLGLSTVYGIVSAQNGIIEVSSKVGEGTTFTLFLPSRKPEGMKIKPADRESKESLDGQETVLVVEDEPGLRDLLYDIFGGHGYKVLTAEDGQRALALFLDHKDIELVVSDIGLPKVGGLDLYEAMKKLKPDIKVIMVSGFADEADRQNMLERGVDAFIQKPYDAVDLLRKAREVLESKRTRP